jgi:hypothetical protein
MNLGERLKAATAAEEEAARRAARARQAAQDEKTFEVTLRAQHFFDYAYQLFAFRLVNDQPVGKVELGGKSFRDVAALLNVSSWKIPRGVPGAWRHGSGVWRSDNPLYDVWAGFAARCTSAGLEPQWSYEHDGMAGDSWYVLTVTPAAA